MENKTLAELAKIYRDVIEAEHKEMNRLMAGTGFIACMFMGESEKPMYTVWRPWEVDLAAKFDHAGKITDQGGYTVEQLKPVIRILIEQGGF